jgi:hypothetical protein
MPQTLKLWDQPDLMLATLSEQFLYLIGAACAAPAQLRMRRILVPVIDLTDYHIDAEPGQISDDACHLLDRPSATDANVNAAPGLLAVR